MSSLTELDASCNQLTHLPQHLSELPHLKSLILRNNLLLCLPVEVTFLRLVRLDVRANRIATLPVELRLMKTLIELYVDDNPLISPPASVSHLFFAFYSLVFSVCVCRCCFFNMLLFFVCFFVHIRAGLY